MGLLQSVMEANLLVSRTSAQQAPRPPLTLSHSWRAAVGCRTQGLPEKANTRQYNTVLKSCQIARAQPLAWKATAPSRRSAQA